MYLFWQKDFRNVMQKDIMVINAYTNIYYTHKYVCVIISFYQLILIFILYASHISIHNTCVYHISIMLIVIITNIIDSVWNIRKENLYPIKTEDQCTFIRNTILHYHDWRKTEIDESDFIKYGKRHFNADKKTGLFDRSWNNIMHYLTE